MTHRSARTGEVGVVLPADWHVVDLSTDATRHADVVALVDRQLPRRDDLATVRRRLRREIEDSSRRAAQAGGRFSAYMLTAVGPVPLPAVLTASRTPGSLDSADALAALAATLTERLGTRAGGVDIGEGPLGPVVRAVTLRTTTTDGTGPRAGAPGVAAIIEPRTDLLVCDYWSDPDDGGGLLLLSFSTPLVPLRDALLDLFDTIAGSTHRSPTDLGDPEPYGA